MKPKRTAGDVSGILGLGKFTTSLSGELYRAKALSKGSCFETSELVPRTKAGVALKNVN
jgi:hypothetical protein